MSGAVIPLVRRHRSALVVSPLVAGDIAALQFRSWRDERLVREHLQTLLQAPQWAFAARLDGKLAAIGGFVWTTPHWCHAALAPARWLRPMQWRALLPAMRDQLGRAQRAGATRIEALVDGRNAPAHRLLMGLGFSFCGLQLGRDGFDGVPWCVYAIAPPPPLPIAVALIETHARVLATLEAG